MLALQSRTAKGRVYFMRTIRTASCGSSLVALHAEAPLIGEILNFHHKGSFLTFCFRLLSFCLLGLPAFSFLLLLYSLAIVHAGIPSLPPSISITSVALDVYFAANSDRISQKYYPSLNRLGEALQRMNRVIYIEGHTDSLGSEPALLR